MCKNNKKDRYGRIMRNRNPILVFVFSFITLGIYGIYWMVSTKNEMNRMGTHIPTAWLLIIPFVSIYWMWKYSEGVGQVSRNQLSAPVAFLLLFLLGAIGMPIIQNTFNKVIPHQQQIPQARVA